MQNVLVLHLIQWYPMWVCFCSLSLQGKGQTKYQIWTVCEWHTQNKCVRKKQTSFAVVYIYSEKKFVIQISILLLGK